MNFRTSSPPWTKPCTREQSVPISPTIPFPPQVLQAQPAHQFLVSVDLTVLGISCDGMVQYIFFRDWLLLLHMFAKFVHVEHPWALHGFLLQNTVPLHGSLVLGAGASGLFPLFGSSAWSGIVIWIYPVPPTVCIPACKINLTSNALFLWLYPAFRYGIFTCETLFTDHSIP